MPYRVDDPCWFSGHMVIGQGQTVGLWIKRPLGHITHLRNQFKSINTFGNSYDYIIMLSWRGKKPIISFLIIDISFFVKPWSSCLHQRMLCAKFWLKLAKWFWRRFFNLGNGFLLFHNYFPLEKLTWVFRWAQNVVGSVSLDPFAGKLPNLVRWMPLESRCPVTPNGVQVTWSKVKVTLLFYKKCCLLNI